MPLVTKTMLVCDRCGSSVPVGDNAMPLDVAEGLPGWTRVSGDRFLCPECSPGHELLVSRHRLELENYITGADSNG